MKQASADRGVKANTSPPPDAPFVTDEFAAFTPPLLEEEEEEACCGGGDVKISSMFCPFDRTISLLPLEGGMIRIQGEVTVG